MYIIFKLIQKLPQIMMSLLVDMLKCQHNGGVERSRSNLIDFFVIQIACTFQIFIVNYVNEVWIAATMVSVVVAAKFLVQFGYM